MDVSKKLLKKKTSSLACKNMISKALKENNAKLRIRRGAISI